MNEIKLHIFKKYDEFRFMYGNGINYMVVIYVDENLIDRCWQKTEIFNKRMYKTWGCI